MRDTSSEKGAPRMTEETSEDTKDIASSSQSEDDSESESNGLPARDLRRCKYSGLWVMSKVEKSDLRLCDLMGETQVVGKSPASCCVAISIGTVSSRLSTYLNKNVTHLG